MRFIKDNRYMYRVYKQSGSYCFPLNWLLMAIWGGIVLLSYPFVGWAYVKDIKKDGNVVRLRGKYKNVQMYVPLFERDIIQKYIAKSESFYEINELTYIKEKYLKKNYTYLDIGANIGNHTVFFGKICKARKIYSFEPINSTYQSLLKNVELNNLQKIVQVYHVGCGEASGYGEIEHYYETNTGAASIKATDHGSLKIISLDELDIPDKIDFIKIDVEGFEYSVLKGMECLLYNNEPIIFVEIFENNYKKTNDLLIEYGFEMVEKLNGSNYVYRKNKSIYPQKRQ